MSPRYQVNVSVLSGAEFYQEFTLTEADFTPLNLTGCKIYAAIAKHGNALDANSSTTEQPIRPKIAFSAVIDNALEGKISLYLAPVYTRMLDEGKYVYSVSVENDKGNIIEVVNGLAFVEKAFSAIDPLVSTPRL